MKFRVEKYTEEFSEVWDDFILNKSINGTILQTRRFLNYHPEGRFIDCSLMILKGNEIVAEIPACKIVEKGKNVFFSHKGSTFGGVCVSENIMKSSTMKDIFLIIENYLIKNDFDEAFFKCVPNLYSRMNTDLLDYFFIKNGFKQYSELNFYLNLDEYKNDVLSQFSSSKRRDFRYSLKNNLEFRALANEEIVDFYAILLENLEKHDARVVHTIDELFDLYTNRLKDEMGFYGVFHNGEMIAGSMVFYFRNKVFHTQYLAAKKDTLHLFPMEFMIKNLIDVAITKQFSRFSFGICTEEKGKYLNEGLARFKEGFGAKYCINNSYEIVIN